MAPGKEPHISISLEKSTVSHSKLHDVYPKPLYPIDTTQSIAVLITKEQYPGFLPVASETASGTQFLSVNNTWPQFHENLAYSQYDRDKDAMCLEWIKLSNVTWHLTVLPTQTEHTMNSWPASPFPQSTKHCMGKGQGIIFKLQLQSLPGKHGNNEAHEETRERNAVTLERIRRPDDQVML